MALSASVAWEIRQAGNNNNGGGFKTGASGTDRTLGTTAFASLTTLSVVNATTTKITVSPTDYVVVLADIGNVLHVTGGTATAGFYEITGADIVLGTWTLDRAVGTAGQTVVGAMGGALADPGYWSGIAQLAFGQIAFLKNDGSVFSITSASTNVAGGCLSGTVSNLIVGYGSTRTITNTDSPPTIQLNVSTATLTAGAYHLINILCDGNSQTAAKLSAGSYFTRCQFTGFNTATTGNNVFVGCRATANSATVLFGSSFYCEAYANTATPFSCTGANNAVVGCVSSANTGASTDGFSITSTAVIFNSIAYNNGRDGIRMVTGSYALAVNCHAESNTSGVGFNYTGGGFALLMNCSTYLNATATSGITSTIGGVALSASAFVDAAANNFALNAVSGGGNALRSVGYPATFPRGLTASYPDIGATQHYGIVPPFHTDGGTQ